MISAEEIANRRQLLTRRRKPRSILHPKSILARPNLTPGKVYRAIQGSGGDIPAIARILGVKHYTLNRLLAQAKVKRRWTKVMKLLEFENELYVQQALQNIRDSVNPEINPDLESRFNASKYVADRKIAGFAPKQTTTIEGGEKPLQQTTQVDIRVLLAKVPPEVAREELERLDGLEETARKTELKPVDGVLVKAKNKG